MSFKNKVSKHKSFNKVLTLKNEEFVNDCNYTEMDIGHTHRVTSQIDFLNLTKIF